MMNVYGIEEEFPLVSQYSPTLLEQQLIEGVLDSLQNHLTQNATFLAERLVYEHDTEEFRSLLAECYLQENKPHKAYSILKDCKKEYNRYQQAVAYFKAGKIEEAEKALLGQTNNSLMVLIATKNKFQNNRNPRPKFQMALLDTFSLDRYMKNERDLMKQNSNTTRHQNRILLYGWHSKDQPKQEKQFKLINQYQFFNDQKYKTHEQQRKQGNCNILKTINNLLGSKLNQSRLSTSGQKEPRQFEVEDYENKKDEQQENVNLPDYPKILRNLRHQDISHPQECRLPRQLVRLLHHNSQGMALTWRIPIVR